MRPDKSIMIYNQHQQNIKIIIYQLFNLIFKWTQIQKHLKLKHSKIIISHLIKFKRFNIPYLLSSSNRNKIYSHCKINRTRLQIYIWILNFKINNLIILTIRIIFLIRWSKTLSNNNKSNNNNNRNNNNGKHKH